MASRQFLTEQELREKVPAAFATQPADGLSKRYVFVPTDKTIIHNLNKLGWYPIYARQNKSKKKRGDKWGKHVIRFAKEQGLLKKGDYVEELLYVGCHDGTYKIELNLAIKVCICDNQAVVVDSEFTTIAQKHFNFEIKDFEKITKQAVRQFSILSKKINEFKSIELSKKEKEKFAKQAKTAYWGENSIIDPKVLLNTRRVENEKDDLWTVYNVVQENIQKGGIEYKGYSEKTKKERKRKTRATKNIIRDIDINKKLWTIMQALAVSRIG